MERVVNKFRNFREAEEREIQQQLAMSPAERMEAAKQIRDRMFPGEQPDVKEWHREKTKNDGGLSLESIRPIEKSARI